MGKQGRIYGHQVTSLPTTSMGEFILDCLRKGGDHPYMIDGLNGDQLTFKALLEKSVKFAKFLEKYGIKFGDRISIISENKLNWMIPAYATFYIGAIFTPYNPMYTEWEYKNLLDITKPRLIFVSRRNEELFVKLLPNLSWQVELIQLDDKPLSANIRTLRDILNNEESVDCFEYRPTVIDDNNKYPAAILSSSGTTGLPKGVALSHRNILIITNNLSKPEILGMEPDDKGLVFLPFYHGFGVVLLLVSLWHNTTNVVIPTFEPELFLRLIQEYKITRLPVVPPILTFLAKHPLVERYDFSTVREIESGAAPIPKDLISEVKARLGVKVIRNGYGMTEVSMVSNVSSIEDEDINALSELMPGLISKVINLETQETLNTNEVGEICFKGPQVMMGYWNNPEATKKIIDEDGWLHTGDIGYYDEQKRLHVIDRLKELIKYKGYQVSPSEIETVLLSHPAVKDVAVIGKPDQLSGEVPIAFVVKQPNAKVTAQNITEFVKQKLSPQKWLRGGVQFVDAIPKNPTGKILRREVRAMISKL